MHKRRKKNSSLSVFFFFLNPGIDNKTHNTTFLWVYTVAIYASIGEQQRIRGNSENLNDNIAVLIHMKTINEKETFKSINISASHRSM